MKLLLLRGAQALLRAQEAPLLEPLKALAPQEALEREDAEVPAQQLVEPSLAVLLPSVADPLTLARRLRAAWPSTHLLIVRPESDVPQLRRALGPAPMLGRHWSLTPWATPQVMAAAQQALDAARQRRMFRATLDSTNARLAASQAVPRSELQRLLTAERHLLNFLRHGRDAVIGLSAAQKVIFWSRGAELLLGRPAALALDQAIVALEPWGPQLADAARAVLASGQQASLETPSSSESEPVLEWVLSALPQDGTESTGGVSIVVRDVTERRRAQERLQEANRSLGELVAERTHELERSQLALIQAQKLEAIGKLTGGVAHDFNNVLQVVGSNLQLLQLKLGSSHQADGLVRSALSAVERGAKLSSQLLAFARRQPLNPVPLNVSRRVQDMDELIRRALGEQIEVESVLGAGLWTTLADPVQLENVILNLAINARDAMPQGGRLTLETSNCALDEEYARAAGDVLPGQYVMVAVSDNGEGMPPEVAAHAFEPFFTTKPEGKGTGLGLSMAYGFAKQSGGHIRIYSEPGVGTTVKLYLPRSHEPVVQPPRLSSSPVTGGSETILVVEDDAAVQTAAVNMLQVLGYTVLRANDAQAALSILQSGLHVDLLFTDVVMPGPLRSPELARQARALLPGIAVLFTSGYTQNAIVHGGRLDPGVELLSKPYRHEALARKVRQLLGARQAAADGAATPADAPPPPAAQLTPAPPRVPAGRRVLLVEDEPDARETTSQLLEMMDYTVQAVGSAEEAQLALAKQPFDVLLTDVSLPGRSGIALAGDAAQQHPSMRLVFCSGWGDALQVPAGLAYRVLAKPFSFDELEAVLGG